RGGPSPSLREWASTAAFAPVGPGITFARLDGPTEWGPQHVCVLRIERVAATLDVLDAWQEWGLTQDLSTRVRETGAVAAFSGGFFLYSEPDIGDPCLRHDPVGLMVRDGAVLRPATLGRAALVQDGSGRFEIRVVGCDDHRLELGTTGGHPTAWTNRAQAARASGVAIVDQRVVAAGADVSVPLNGVVVEQIDGRPVHAAPGEPARWGLPGVTAGIAGGPMLVRNGQVGFDLAAEDFAGTAPLRTFVDDETADRHVSRSGSGSLALAGSRPRAVLSLASLPARTPDRSILPRMAVGLTEEGGCSWLPSTVETRSERWASA
ncbi:MAG: hypothetical protein AAF602_14750, partial [Myxococcota bacterium]